MSKSLTKALKDATGLSVKKNETRIHAKYPDSADKTSMLYRFGNKFFVNETTDMALPTPTEISVPTLPGRAGVSS